MKVLIKYAIELDIGELHIKEGYNGAPLLVVTTKNKDVAERILVFARNIALETKMHSFGDKYKISSVFGEDTIDNEFYKIKE